jgi:hypothetical protein
VRPTHHEVVRAFAAMPQKEGAWVRYPRTALYDGGAALCDGGANSVRETAPCGHNIIWRSLLQLKVQFRFWHGEGPHYSHAVHAKHVFVCRRPTEPVHKKVGAVAHMRTHVWGRHAHAIEKMKKDVWGRYRGSLSGLIVPLAIPNDIILSQLSR